jgi:hypothetical protein
VSITIGIDIKTNTNISINANRTSFPNLSHSRLSHGLGKAWESRCLGSPESGILGILGILQVF